MQYIVPVHFTITAPATDEALRIMRRALYELENLDQLPPYSILPPHREEIPYDELDY